MKKLKKVPKMLEEFFETKPRYYLTVSADYEVLVSIYDKKSMGPLQQAITKLKAGSNYSSDFCLKSDEIPELTVVVAVSDKRFFPLYKEVVLKYGAYNKSNIKFHDINWR